MGNEVRKRGMMDWKGTKEEELKREVNESGKK